MWPNLDYFIAQGTIAVSTAEKNNRDCDDNRTVYISNLYSMLKILLFMNTANWQGLVIELKHHTLDCYI